MHRVIFILTLAVFIALSIGPLHAADRGSQSNCNVAKLTLNQAIANYKFKEARCLIEQGVDLSIPLKDGSSYLGTALYAAHYEFIKLMIDKGAEPSPNDQPFLDILAFRLDNLINDSKFYSSKNKQRFYQRDPRHRNMLVTDIHKIIELILIHKFDRLDRDNKEIKNTNLAIIVNSICTLADEANFNWRPSLEILEKHSHGLAKFNDVDYLTLLPEMREKIYAEPDVKKTLAFQCHQRAMQSFGRAST